jgi:hypothetical protein
VNLIFKIDPTYFSIKYSTLEIIKGLIVQKERNNQQLKEVVEVFMELL